MGAAWDHTGSRHTLVISINVVLRIYETPQGLETGSLVLSRGCKVPLGWNRSDLLCRRQSLLFKSLSCSHFLWRASSMLSRLPMGQSITTQLCQNSPLADWECYYGIHKVFSSGLVPTNQSTFLIVELQTQCHSHSLYLLEILKNLGC